MEPKTINQLLDAFSEIKIDSMTEELSITRQQLINAKRAHPKGGLIPIKNTPEIMQLINAAINNSK